MPLTRITDPRVVARFWAKVDRSGGPGACWPWLAARSRPRGYGAFKLRSYVQVLSHRAAYAIAVGPIPAEPPDLAVCHACDHPWCCNPAHLSLGTQTDNALDMVAKGRGWFQVNPGRVLRGERHPVAKLTWAQVGVIRDRYAVRDQVPVTQQQLAAEYGVTANMIGQIVRGRRWKAPR